VIVVWGSIRDIRLSHRAGAAPASSISAGTGPLEQEKPINAPVMTTDLIINKRFMIYLTQS
jgi:hypothetical protein